MCVTTHSYRKKNYLTWLVRKSVAGACLLGSLGGWRGGCGSYVTQDSCTSRRVLLSTLRKEIPECHLYYILCVTHYFHIYHQSEHILSILYIYLYYIDIYRYII